MKDWFNISFKVFYLNVKVKIIKQKTKEKSLKILVVYLLFIDWYLFIDRLRNVKLNMGLCRWSHDFECNLEWINTSKFLKNLRVLIYSKLHEENHVITC